MPRTLSGLLGFIGFVGLIGFKLKRGRPSVSARPAIRSKF